MLRASTGACTAWAPARRAKASSRDDEGAVRRVFHSPSFFLELLLLLAPLLPALLPLFPATASDPGAAAARRVHERRAERLQTEPVDGARGVRTRDADEARASMVHSMSSRKLTI